MKKLLILGVFLIGFVFAANTNLFNPLTTSESVKLGLISFATKTCIDPNTASFDELQSIKHIGIDEAVSILKLRNTIDFTSVKDLNYISGLDEDELGELRNELCYT